MNIHISMSDNTPIYEQLTNQIKSAILTGQLQPGEALPSIRQLAKHLKISVITTKRAYDELEKEQFIVSKQGKGSYVNKQHIDFIRQKQRSVIENEINNIIKLCKTYSVDKKELINLIEQLYE